jgi:hypothetical protein
LPKVPKELHSNVNEFLQEISFWPERIMRYFCYPAVQYATANTV